MSKAEIASVSHYKKVEIAKYEWNGFIRAEKCKNNSNPCQKPVYLYRWILKNYTKQGDETFDSHLAAQVQLMKHINEF